MLGRLSLHTLRYVHACTHILMSLLCSEPHDLRLNIHIFLHDEYE